MRHGASKLNVAMILNEGKLMLLLAGRVSYGITDDLYRYHEIATPSSGTQF